MGHNSPEKTNTTKLEQALKSGPIGKTILFYAIPSVVSLVVNGLYNIVDQIFIGQGTLREFFYCPVCLWELVYCKKWRRAP